MQYGRMNNLEMHILVETMNEYTLGKPNNLEDEIEAPRATADSVEPGHQMPNNKKRENTNGDHAAYRS